ncbi:hypothetical protein Q7A53_05945 [Halobacillus rhizosphaerae]|uniref:hypothetical protein n=1 Tax=Halobacillus rhizosphaerae TaxID=3064889 RepID=UPI00398A9F11
MLEFLSLLIGYYLFAVVSAYTYGVYKTWEMLGILNFKFKDGCIGIVKFPKLLSFWNLFKKGAK